MTASRTARHVRLTPRAATTGLAGLVVLLTVLVFPLAALASQLTLGSFWSSSGVLVIVLVIAAVGLVVAGHQPANPTGWLLAGESVFMLLTVDTGFAADLMYGHGQGMPVLGPALLALSQLFSYSLIGFPLVILLFPDGRLPSRRWRWVLWVYLALAASAVLATVAGTVGIALGQHVVLDGAGNLQSLGRGSTAWLIPVQTAFFCTVGAFWLAAVTHQAVSWRGATGERRQQLKWLATGAAICGVLGIWAITTSSAIWQVLILGFAALPLAIGVGILKYRLYEIDRIISRTLAYAIVTGLLVGLYAGLVLLATHVLGFRAPVAVAASTLAAVALFAPVRRRVQRIVDRRFNRARYDADQTIAMFAARLPGAVDLDTVRIDLTCVVSAALEPEHVSLWIAGDGP